jgi:ribosomal protein L24
LRASVEDSTLHASEPVNNPETSVAELIEQVSVDKTNDSTEQVVDELSGNKDSVFAQADQAPDSLDNQSEPALFEEVKAPLIVKEVSDSTIKVSNEQFVIQETASASDTQDAPTEPAFDNNIGLKEESSKSQRQRVSIHTGSNKGKEGSVVGLKDKRTYMVEIDGGVVVTVRMSSVSLLETNGVAGVSSTKPPTAVQEETATKLSAGDEPPTLTSPSHVASLKEDDNISRPETTQVSPKMVEILKGNHKGLKGRIIRPKGKATLVVDIEGVGIRDVRRTSVDFLRGLEPLHAAKAKSLQSTLPMTSTMPEHSSSSLQERAVPIEPDLLPQSNSETTPCEDVSSGSDSRRVKITAGTHKGSTRVVVGVKGKKTYVVEIEGVGSVDKRTSSAQFLDFAGGQAPPDLFSSLASRSASPKASSKALPPAGFNSGDAWRVADSKSGGTRLGAKWIVKLRLELEKSAKETTFLDHLLENRTMMVEIPLNDKETTVPFDRHMTHQNCEYALISTKVQADGDVNTGSFFKP